MNRIRKETLKENIERLDAQEHAQILVVINKYTTDYTKTQNGALISSDVLSNECLLEVEKLVSFYMDQRKMIDFNRRQ